MKNVFELYPGGYARAVKEFDKAWRWGTETYPYSSLKEAARLEVSPIVDASLIRDVFRSAADFKTCSRDMIFGRQGDSIEAVTFE